MRCVPALLVSALAFTGFDGSPGQAVSRSLSFEQRVAAQEAIERVFYRHQIGATRSFEKAVPRSLLESKVRLYLARSAALERIWHSPISPEALQSELRRMARRTRLPQRLIEIYAALGNDSFLIQETLVRAALADRLFRAFSAGTSPEASSAAALLDQPVREIIPVASRNVALPQPRAVAACADDDTWDNGINTDPPPPLYQHTAVWTGTQMLLRGGPLSSDGARYDPLLDSWHPMSSLGAPSIRFLHTAVWTGEEMIIWGGYDGTSNTRTGGLYNAVSDTWRSTSLFNAPEPRAQHTAVWTGTEMIVWGGENPSGLSTGGRYHPATDTWTATQTQGSPTGRWSHLAVWSGDRMIVWGGEDGVRLSTGGRYDPGQNQWLSTSLAGVPEGRIGASGVWTGAEMLVWGGDALNTTDSGALYDPELDTWRATSTTAAPAPRFAHTAVWTGEEMIVWGGSDHSVLSPGSGGRYNPAGDSWRFTSLTDEPEGRSGHTAIWTGESMIVWGGHSQTEPLNSGGRYVAALFADRDMDGVSVCAADCNDSDAQAWSRPGPVPDLVLLPDTVTLSWSLPAEPGAVTIAYDVIRSSSPADFVAGSTCVESNDTDLSALDASQPMPGAIHCFLVRARNGCPAGIGSGSVGTDSQGAPRSARGCP